MNAAIRAVIATVLAWSACITQGQPDVDPEALAEAKTLLRDMVTMQDVQTSAQTSKTQFTPALANAAERLLAEARGDAKFDDARAALLLVSLVYRQLGLTDRSVNASLDRLQILHQLAKTAAAYAEVRAAARELQGQAEQAGLTDFAFRCAVLAADAAYFGGIATDAPASEIDGPLNALQDLQQAWPLAGETKSDGWIERLASLTATVVSAIHLKPMLDEKVEQPLQRLAAWTERWLPPDFAYGDPTIGGLRKSIATASALARLSFNYGSAGVAIERLAAAEQRAAQLGDINLRIEILFDRYDGERRSGARPAQLQRLRKDAWRRAQDLRNHFRSGAGRIWAAYRTDKLLGTMLHDELEGGAADPALLFGHVESMKARTLFDRLNSGNDKELQSAAANTLEAKVLSFEHAKSDDGNGILAEMRLASQLSNFSFSMREDGSRTDAVRALEDLYRGAGAGYQASAGAVALADLQKAIGTNEALIEYVIPPGPQGVQNLWMLLITRDRIRVARIALGARGRIQFNGEAPIDGSALGDLVITLRTEIRSSEDKSARRRLAALYKLLIDPLAAQGFQPEAFKRLIIVPHSVLHLVPFGALLDTNGKFLISKAEIVVAPSASVWQLLSQRRRAPGRLVAFANPDLSSLALPALPFADQEGTEIAASTPTADVRLFKASQATLSRLVAEAPAAEILHLATHGEFPDESAANAHALWLADEGGKASALKSGDARALNLRAAHLVVLSVCNGGLYRIGPSDEPYGLIPAFLEAGASNVLGTLWPLDDKFGRDFMIEFYRQLPERGVAGALRYASLRFIANDEYLRNWAAFLLVGSGRFD